MGKILAICVTLDAGRQIPAGFLKGHIDVRAPDRGLMVSIPVNALVK
jgi:hypothetical protein